MFKIDFMIDKFLAVTDKLLFDDDWPPFKDEVDDVDEVVANKCKGGSIATTCICRSYESS
jgi:hypothetical protein